jgi:hypothetical protein
MTDDDHDLHFLLLSDANYTEWVMQMEAEWIEKGLWEQVFIELNVNGKTIQEIEREWVKGVTMRNMKKISKGSSNSLGERVSLKV